MEQNIKYVVPSILNIKNEKWFDSLSSVALVLCIECTILSKKNSYLIGCKTVLANNKKELNVKITSLKKKKPSQIP